MGPSVGDWRALRRLNDNARHKSPNVLSRLKKRCMARMRQSREKIVQDRANGVSTARLILYDELVNNRDPSESAKDESGAMGMEIENGLATIVKMTSDEMDSFMNSSDGQDLECDVLIGILDNLTETLKREEQLLLQEEATHEQELQERELQACIDHMEAVICPLCQANNLLQNKHIIFCRCGLRLDTQYDAVSLPHIKQSLDRAVAKHSQQCREEPGFHLMDQGGVQLLCLGCNSCGALEIII